MKRGKFMINVLLITRDEKRKEFLGNLLGSEYFILICGSEQTIEHLVPLVDLVIVDLSSIEREGLNVITRVRESRDSTVILGFGSEVKKEIVQAAREGGLGEYIDVDKDAALLSAVVKDKMEKKMLISGIEERKLSRDSFHSVPPLDKERTLSPEEWKFLEELSRFLIYGYDLNDLMQFFLGLLNKVFAIPRLCFMLKDKTKKNYRIRASLGMTEEAEEYVQLYPERGLVKFLAKEGTVLTKEHVLKTDYKTAYEIRRDMKLIQSNVVVPLSPHGELLGILGLGPKVTGDKMSPKEIKEVFLFCNQVGLAIQNLLFYEEMSCQKKYIENVLKDAASGVVSVDTEQKITTCNPRAQEVLNLGGYPSLVGQDMRKLPSPLGDLLFETLTQSTLHERKEVYVPGLKRWLGISTSQVKDTQGEASGSVMIFTDLTPVKYLQEEKEKAQKRDFLAQVAVRLSHELRNSLVPIKSLAELLPSKYLDEEFRKRLFFSVTKEIERIDSLIEHLVFFSQPLHLDRAAESFPSLITEILEKIRKKTPAERKIQLNVSCKEENLHVYVDRRAITEALSHIVDNSIEVVAEGAARIDINCEATDKLPDALPVKTPGKAVTQEPRQYVKIEIKDNGPGLPGKNVESNRIFDPFFTTKNRGIGLGLTISERIIKEHGGSIVPLSQEGNGATMAVYLPRYQPPT